MSSQMVNHLSQAKRAFRWLVGTTFFVQVTDFSIGQPAT
jgi:hypothetical protein